VYYFAIAVAVFVAIIVGRLAYYSWIGRRMAHAMLTGRFDHSPVGQTFTLWFQNRPQREEQRAAFVEFALAVGMPPDRVANQVVGCVTKALRGKHDLGELLAREVEKMIVFDPPKTAEQEIQQQVSKQDLEKFRARLRLLDRDVS
jgi:hypothetical protein